MRNRTFLFLVLLGTACDGGSPPDEVGDAWGLSLESGVVQIAVGERVTLEAAPVTSTGAPVTGIYTLGWSSSNAAVASLTSDGRLLGVADGTSTITVKATLLATNKTASSTMTVQVGTAVTATTTAGTAPDFGSAPTPDMAPPTSAPDLGGPPPTATGLTPKYFVDASSPAANDSNAGTSAAAPWKTLARVNSAALVAGDVVGLRRGTTYTGALNLTKSGTQAAPIGITAYGSGALPLISNPGSYTSSVNINANWNIVELIAASQSTYGVSIPSGRQHNVVRDSEFFDTGMGVVVDGSYNLVTRSYAHDLNMVRNTVGGDDDYGANGFTFEGPNNELSYSRCVRCRAPSYDYGYDGGLIELYGTFDNCYIHHNYAEETNGFVEMGGTSTGSGTNVTVAYNVSYNNFGDFATLHVAGGFAVPVNNVRLENNTIVDTVTAGTFLWTSSGATLNPGQVYFRNNIVSMPGGTAIGNATVTHDHNLIYSTNGGTWVRDGSLAATEKVANPMFVNLAGKDFHLAAGSPAINYGAALGYTVDFDGAAVPVGGTPDVGAYERH
jgi:hypothetical protein